jgi:hypothetical protein
MTTVYHEVLEAALRLKADKVAATLADSPYGKLVTQTCNWTALRAKDEALLKEWALERLLDPPEESEKPEKQVRCFVCDVELGTLSEAYPAVVAAISGNYGSTVYDPIPTRQLENADKNSDANLYLHICDMCLCEKANYLESTEEARHNLSLSVTLPYETVEGFPEALKARYKKHLEWVEKNV